MISGNVKIEIPSNFGRLDTNRYKLFALNEFYRLYFDYVPADTMALAREVDISRKGIHHEVLYADKVYRGVGMNFKKDLHPLATKEWDKIAYQQNKTRYLRTLQRALGRFA